MRIISRCLVGLFVACRDTDGNRRRRSSHLGLSAQQSRLKPPVDDGKPIRVPDSSAGYAWSQLAIVSLRRFGTPATTARCQTSSRTAANPACSHADIVTAPPDPAVRKRRPCRAAESYIIQQMAD